MSENKVGSSLMSALARYNRQTNGDTREALKLFRANSPLPKNSQEVIDDAVIRVGRQRLTIVDDLINAGLTKPLTNWLGVPLLTSHRVGEAGYAQVTMVPKARGERQLPERTPYTVPIPCTWDDFSYDIRTQAAAERTGTPLETDQVEQSTRNVNESIEDQAINGGPQVDGNRAIGLLESTSTQAFVDNESWTAAGHSGDDIFRDVQNMVGIAVDKRFPGPYNLYVNSTYGLKLGEDFKANGDRSILERLTATPYGSRSLNIRIADMLPADTVLLIQMTSDVVDVIVGQTPTPVSWSDGPGWEEFFVVLACIVPRVKSNSNGDFGVVVGSLNG